MVQTIGKAINTGEEIVQLDTEDGKMLAFVGEKSVELKVMSFSKDSNSETCMIMDRKQWDSFAGSSLRLARKSDIPVV